MTAGLQTRRRSIDIALEEFLSDCATAPGPVSEAMRYAVLGAGQRLRPMLSMAVAEAVGSDLSLARRGALSVELLHCASLIIDDLPCMDNELFRRGRPSVHAKFGEATAVLAAFGLVSVSAKSLLLGLHDADDLLEMAHFQKEFLSALDCNGLIAGQSLDLIHSGATREVQRQRINELKTVPLFVLAVRAGLLGASLEDALYEKLIDFGRQFGICYQMADDLADGEGGDVHRMRLQMRRARACLQSLPCATGPLQELIDYVHGRS